MSNVIYTKDIFGEILPLTFNNVHFDVKDNKLIINSHYRYLDLFLDDLWKKEFGMSLEEAWCNGIVSAHGDKCRQYKHLWEQNNIPFERGAALYMLTYTASMDREKWESDKFVIDKYPLYKEFFDKLELDFIEKYSK